jgi:UPF0716 protein FxsA
MILAYRTRAAIIQIRRANTYLVRVGLEMRHGQAKMVISDRTSQTSAAYDWSVEHWKRGNRHLQPPITHFQTILNNMPLVGVGNLILERKTALRISILPILIVLALPLLEIAGFVLVGRQIGVLPTLGLVLASGIAGSALLRHQGFGVMSRIRAEMEAGRDPSRQLAHGVMILLAGILLLIPGFFTDIFGILLFIPPIRDVVWRFLRKRVVVTSFGSASGGFSSRPGPGRDKTIDLNQDDYSNNPSGDSPWRKLRDE